MAKRKFRMGELVRLKPGVATFVPTRTMFVVAYDYDPWGHRGYYGLAERSNTILVRRWLPSAYLEKLKISEEPLYY